MNPAKPTERTRDLYRFELRAAHGGSVQLEVVEERISVADGHVLEAPDEDTECIRLSLPGPDHDDVECIHLQVKSHRRGKRLVARWDVQRPTREQ